MIGVKFKSDVRPWATGDTALLPDTVAQAVVDSGEAELYDFPDQPYAHEAGFVVPVTKPMRPGKDYVAKKGR
jgi:hypothetical protein